VSLWAGFDVGGQTLKAVSVDEAGRIARRASVHTGPGTGVDELARAVTAALGDLAIADARAIGVGIAGCVTLDGEIRGSPNLPRLSGVALVRTLAEALGRSVLVDNDAHCHALAEAWTGAARSEPSFMLVTLGSGVGSGLVLNGRVYRGTTGFGCELGHMIFRPDGRRCGCGNRGCLEAYVSEVALHSRLADDAPALAERVRAKILSDDMGHAEALFHLAAAADPEAGEMAGQLARELGIALASVVNLFDLELLLLGGGIAPAMLMREGEIRRAMATGLFARDERSIRLLPAAAGTWAGAVGAARMAMLSV
jgi:glucokinase